MCETMILHTIRPMYYQEMRNIQTNDAQITILIITHKRKDGSIK